MLMENGMQRKQGGEFLTVAKVATKLNVSERSVRRWISDGSLTVHRFGRSVRVNGHDLRDFVRNGNGTTSRS